MSLFVDQSHPPAKRAKGKWKRNFKASLSSSLNRCRRMEIRMYVESEKAVGHSTTFQKSTMVSYYPPPPKKAKESEWASVTEFGISADFPDSRLKKEFDEQTVHGLNGSGSEIRTNFPDAPIKKEFDSDGESYHFDISEEGVDVGVTFDSSGLLATGARKQIADFDDHLHGKSKVKEDEARVRVLENEPIIKMEVFPDNHYVPAKMEQWNTGNEDFSSDSELQGQEVVEQPKANETDDYRRCIYCRFKSSSGESLNNLRDIMDLHLVRYHPEHFFSVEQERVSGVKCKQFRRILVDFLFPEFIRKVGAQRTCTLCKVEYRMRQWSKNDIAMKKHLVVKHGNELKARLSTMLEDEGLEAKLTSCRSEGVWCPCGVYLGRREKMQTQHKQFYCKLIVTDSSDDVGIKGSGRMSRKWNGDLELDGGGGGEADTSKLKNADEEPGPGFMANFLPVTAKLKVYCKLCRTTLYRKDAFTHWNHDCLNGLRLPNTSNDEDNDAQSAKKSKEAYSLGCPYCRFVCGADKTGFKKRVELEMHQLRFHPEHYFAKEKEQLSGVKRKQFPRILVGFLFPQFIKKDGDFRYCTLCDERYLSSAWDNKGYTIHRRHLMMQHESELRNRLQVILEDERLEGKLRSCEKVEAWCRCGVYLPRLMETHKKLYCNLTARISAKGYCKGRKQEQDNYCDRGDRSIDHEASQQKSPSSMADRPIHPQKNVSSTLECIYCSYKGMKRKLEAHTVRFHPEHHLPDERDKAAGLGLKLGEFQKLILNSVCPRFIRKVGRFSLCALCDRKYGNADTYERDIMTRKHLIFEHKDKLKEQLKSILEDIGDGGKLSSYA